MRHQRSGYGRWGVRYIVQRVWLLGLWDIVMGQISSTQDSTWDPVKTVCSIVLARGIVLGDKMYVDGGEIVDQQYFRFGIDMPVDSGNIMRWQNEHLWELDLSIKFAVSTPPWTAHSKPQDWNQHYNGASGALWDIGDGKFYTSGGWMSSGMEGPPPGKAVGEPYFTRNSSGSHFQLPDPRVFAYDPKTGNWSSSLLEKGIHRLSDAAYAQSATNRVGYTLGGLLVTESSNALPGYVPNVLPNFIEDVGLPNFVTVESNEQWVYRMTKYDFRSGEFTKIPTKVDITSRAVMHSLERIGDEGILVAFAGRYNNNTQFRPMQEILVYDIKTSVWMMQNATGDIPPGRQNTCTVLVPAPDLSSYQIYVFSGVTNDDVRILDMYVLTIPMFIWKKIDIPTYPDTYGIAEMACALYEERQLIIVPGVANVTVSNMTTSSGKIDYWWVKCNQGTKIQVFDTYDWEFKSEFDPDNKGSKVPPPIVELIGGNETGSAPVHQPLSGWDDPALGPIFLKSNQPPPSNLSTPTPGLNSTSSETQKTAKSNKGAIIGGVIGGICLVALVVGVLIFFWKKHQKSSPVQSRAELQEADPKAEMQVNYNRPKLHELHAYEPPEMSITETGRGTWNTGGDIDHTLH